MNGRVYDPQIGRFISADPTVPDPMYSQDFNRYSYVDNSPLENTDPTGFTPEKGQWLQDAVTGRWFWYGPPAPFTKTSIDFTQIPTDPPGQITIYNQQVAPSDLTSPAPVQKPAAQAPTTAPTTGQKSASVNTSTSGVCFACDEPGYGDTSAEIKVGEGFTGSKSYSIIGNWASPLLPPGSLREDGGTTGTATRNATNNVPHASGVVAIGPMKFSNPNALWASTPPGFARIGHRPLDGLPLELSYKELRLAAAPVLGLILDLTLIKSDDNLWHEQIFYNGGPTGKMNEGFFGKGLFGPGAIQPDPYYPANFSNYSFGPPIYLGPGMSPSDFTSPSGFSTYYNVLTHNCQDWTAAGLLDTELRCNHATGGSQWQPEDDSIASSNSKQSNWSRNVA